MTKEEAKAYFKSIDKARSDLKIIEERISQLQYEMEHPLSSIDYTRDQISGSFKHDRLERHVLKYTQIIYGYLKAYCAKKAELEEMLHEATERILALPVGKRRDILYQHYIKGVSLVDYSEIAEHTEPSRVYHLRDEGIELFASMN